MSKEEPNRDWDAERQELHDKGIADMASVYTKHFKKYKDDNYFDGRPVDTPTRMIAHAIIALVDDRAGADIISLHQSERREMSDVACEIIAQINAQQVADSIYERVQTVDAPKDKPTPPVNPTPSKLDQTMDDMRHVFSELSMASRDEELLETMAAASKWGEREDLNPMERCQGLAHELYSEWGTNSVLTADGTSVPTSPGRNYARVYDLEFADKISARSMRAAKDLFGS